MKVLTEENIAEFKRLKKWVRDFPIEAAMRIEEAEEQLKVRETAHIDLYNDMRVVKDENKQLREALLKIAETNWHTGPTAEYNRSNLIRATKIARAALEESK